MKWKKKWKAFTKLKWKAFERILNGGDDHASVLACVDGIAIRIIDKGGNWKTRTVIKWENIWLDNYVDTHIARNTETVIKNWLDNEIAMLGDEGYPPLDKEEAA